MGVGQTEDYNYIGSNTTSWQCRFTNQNVIHCFHCYSDLIEKNNTMNHPEGQQQHILCQLWVGLPRSHRVKDNHYTSFFDTQKQLHNMPRTLYATCNLNRHCFSVCLRGTGHIFIGRSRNDVNNWVNVTKNLGLLTRVHVKKVSEGNRLRPAVQQPFGRYIHCVYKQHPEHSQKNVAWPPSVLFRLFRVLILPFESEVLLCKSSCISSSSSSSGDLII